MVGERGGAGHVGAVGGFDLEIVREADAFAYSVFEGEELHGVDGEFGTEIELEPFGRLGFLGVFRAETERGTNVGQESGIGDPLGVDPILSVEDAHGPGRRTAPSGGLVVAIPELDFPEDLLGRGEGFAFPGEVDTFGGGDFAGVPEFATVEFEHLRRGRGENAVGGLALAGFVRSHLPAEARRG